MKKTTLKRKDFLELNKKPYFSGKSLHINYRPTKEPVFRLGITVTKKWAGAVGRNQFKRRVKNCLNLQKPLPSYLDIQVRPKKGQKATFVEIQTDLISFFTKKKLEYDNV